MSDSGAAGQPAAGRGYGTRVGNGSAAALRYGKANSDLLRECIDLVTAAGDAILFGRTTDGGAAVVRVLSDKGNGAWYPPTADALEIVLTHVIDIARGL